MNEIAVSMRGISKRFGKKVQANKNVDLDIYKGEILSLLGENGSGKTTLMNMLSGVYYPDEGQIFVGGEEVHIASPKDAYDLGIGMIHQHFKLIDVFTALENILIGLPQSEGEKKCRKEVEDICARYGFELDLDKKIYDMSVSEKETLEIVKTLYRGAQILILDEPTAVLTPQEIRKLFTILRNMRDDGKAVVIITHKLNEVMEISDRISVLRKGENAGTVLKQGTNEQQLTEMMVGEKIVLDIARDYVEEKAKRLEVKNLSVRNIDGKLVVDDVSFDLYSGEILGIAGISGSGQKELLEAIMGLQKCEEGSSVIYNSTAHGVHELVGLSTKEIISYGLHLAFVPEDRLGMGLVGNMHDGQRHAEALPQGKRSLPASQEAGRDGGEDQERAGSPDAGSQLSGQETLGRQRAEDPCRPRDQQQADGPDDGLRGQRTRHQYLLCDLQSAQRGEEEGRRCHLCR